MKISKLLFFKSVAKQPHNKWLVFKSHNFLSSTTKIGHHDIAEILLKVALKHQKSNQIIYLTRIY
jgi:hypothetical protein